MRGLVLAAGLVLLVGCAGRPQATLPDASAQPDLPPTATPVTAEPTAIPAPSAASDSDIRVQITIGDEILTAIMADTEAARALASQLEAGPLTISVSDHGGFEKVGRLSEALPQSDAQMSAVPGDILLYQGNSIVLFYGENTWAYTRLARIEESDEAEIQRVLGAAEDSITLSLAE